MEVTYSMKRHATSPNGKILFFELVTRDIKLVAFITRGSEHRQGDSLLALQKL
jgi:hypothetical protein